jgi:Tol biopolymer transport system component
VAVPGLAALDRARRSDEDGTVEVVRRWRVPGLVVLALACAAPVARAVPVGGTVLLDRPSGFGALPFDGIADSSVGHHALTPDGRFVVFSSESNALLSGDEDTATNVYRLDLTTGALVQVDTTGSGGQPTPGSLNLGASISADGNHVGFFTDSPALAPGASPQHDVFVVKDLTTGALEQASVANGAGGASVDRLDSALLSGDGRHVVFTAESAFPTNVPGLVGSTTTIDAYVRSLDASTTEMVSVTDPGDVEGGGVRDEPDIDFGGDAVAFSTISGLVAGDTDGRDDVYFRTIGGTEHTVLAGDGGSDAAIAGGPAGLEVAWGTGFQDFVASCTTTACAAGMQADHARTGGHDNGGNEAPFFPPEPNATTLPTRVYWESRDPLDPADTNNAPDLYGWDIANNNYDTSIHLMTDGTDSGGGFGSAATNDGAVTVFESSSTALPGSNGLVQQAYIRRAGTDINISQQPFGGATQTSAAGFAIVGSHALSDDGRRVVFTSDAPGLGAPTTDAGPPEEVLVRDVASGQTLLASAATDGTPGNGFSTSPSIDAAGDLVVFESASSNLVSGDTNGADDVFMHDLATGTTTLVDRTAGGHAPVDGASEPVISADGTKVVFVSASPDIPDAPPDGHQHVYEVDLATGEVTLIDRAQDGAPANDGSSDPDIDGDGGRVAFDSSSSNLGGSSSDSVYVRDLSDPAHPTTTWASVPEDGNPADDRASEPLLDRDGGRVAFDEDDPAFGFGIGPDEQVFVRDLAGRSTTLVGTGTAGLANDDAVLQSISADGTRVLFSSEASNLPGAVPFYSDAFLRDLSAGTTVLASTRDGSTDAGRFGAAAFDDGAAISGNGACVAFDSYSDDLVAGGYGSDFQHAFLHALSAACPAGSTPDTTPPVVSRFAVTHKRFAVGGKPTAISASKHHKPAKPPRGTAFTFSLSEAATSRIAITKAAKGHRAGRHKPCGPTRHGQRSNCTRTVTVLTLVRAHTVAGSNSVTFSGRFRGRQLAPGSYTATIVATDPSGNRSRSKRLRFTVVRR